MDESDAQAGLAESVDTQADSACDVTRRLRAWTAGDQGALDALIPLLYEDLRNLASHYLRIERADHTLQTTALVHEAYLRILGQNKISWENRSHFFGIAARLMRQILVDHARRWRAAKRNGGGKQPLHDVMVRVEVRPVRVLALHAALLTLARFDARQARLVELRFFGGLTIHETATVLGVSPATVKREWQLARAWLSRALSEDEDADGR